MSTGWRPPLSEIPERPGVYSFRSAKGTILYIGKALNLRRRIASYVHRHTRQPAKVRRMMARARAVTIEETGSELEALIRESSLLKQETPPFNRLSTRYAALPFVKLTLPEPFPRLLVTRHYVADGSLHLGPFPRYETAETVLLTLQRLFPVRTCEVAIWPGISPSPCSAFQVKKCAAPCVSPAHAMAYPQHIAEMLTLLTGGREAILHRLHEERQHAVDALMFERASHLHTMLSVFDAATRCRPLALMPVAQRHLAVVIARQPPCQEVFFIRHGRFGGRVVLAGGGDDRARLRTVFMHVYAAEGSGVTDRGAVVVDELRIVAA